MFRKLRLSLAMANLAAIVAIFLLLDFGTYIFVRHQFVQGSEFGLNRIADNLVAGRTGWEPPRPPQDGERRNGEHGELKGLGPEHLLPPVEELANVRKLPPGRRPGPAVFYIKINPAGKTLLSSPLTPISGVALESLVERTLDTSKSSGMVVSDQIEYLYRVAPISGNQGSFIVYQDFRHERDLLRLLVTAVGLAGLACVILSLVCSFFMADRALVPIQKAWQQQKEFLADASHELRTPITIIQTNLEILGSNPQETIQSQEHWLDNIREESAGMAKLVDSLLFLARADAHQQLLNHEPFSLGATVTAAADAFRPVASAKGVDLEAFADAQVGVLGDEAKMRQVLNILLDNAIRHTPEGGRVTLTLKNSHQGVLMSVADTGEGIAPEHLENIFRRFYQVDQSRSHGGAGLGLAIAKWIVESHGGTIMVSSKVGEGTKFTVSLPRTGDEVRRRIS